MCYRNAQRETGDIAVAVPPAPENARNATDRLRRSRWPGACAYPHAGPTATSISMGSMLNHATSSTTIETRTIYRAGSSGAHSLPADAHPRPGGMSEKTWPNSGRRPSDFGCSVSPPSSPQGIRAPVVPRRGLAQPAAEVLRTVADTAVVLVSRLGGRRHVSSFVRLKRAGV